MYTVAKLAGRVYVLRVIYNPLFVMKLVTAFLYDIYYKSGSHLALIEGPIKEQWEFGRFRVRI
jgi:hypothetical protein